MRRRVGAATLVIGVVLCGATVWHLRPKQPPYRERREWRMNVGRGEPLTAEGAGSCTLEGESVLAIHRRLVKAEGKSVEPVCKYVFHLPEWPDGEDECVLEYRSGSARAIAGSTVGARITETYYRRRQGGIMYFTSDEPGRIFVSLDARWCRWDSVASGLGVVP